MNDNANAPRRPAAPHLAGRRGFLSRYFGGLRYVGVSFGFMKDHPRLLPYAIIPFIVSALLFLGAVHLAWNVIPGYFSALVSYLSPGDGGFFRQLLYYILCILVGVPVLVAAALLFNVLGGFVAGPFNDALSAKVERIVGGKCPEEGPFFATLRRTALMEAKRLLFYGAAMIALLPTDLVPGLGFACRGLAALFFLAFEYLDYPMARRGLPFAKRLKIVFGRPSWSLGLGSGSALLLLFPPTALLCIPLCVVASTLLYLDVLEPPQADEEVGDARES